MIGRHTLIWDAGTCRDKTIIFHVTENIFCTLWTALDRVVDMNPGRGVPQSIRVYRTAFAVGPPRRIEYRDVAGTKTFKQHRLHLCIIVTFYSRNVKQIVNRCRLHQELRSPAR